MRSELGQADREFAQLARPIVQDLKARLIGLGALALQPPLHSSRNVAEEARALADRVAGWIEIVIEQNDADAARLLLVGMAELREWAEVAASHGMSRAVAAGLSGGYRRTREATDLVWHSELVPEGRTPSYGKEQSDG